MRIRDGRIESIEPAAVADSAPFIMPGLMDAHLHLSLGGRMLSQLDLSTVTSRTEFEQALAKRHRELPPGRWLLAQGWNEANWPGHAAPDAQWLAAAGDRPTVCYRMDHHACVVNEAVLSRIDTRTDPAGGRIERDERGAPTGLLVEAAAWTLINPIIPDPSLAERVAAYDASVTYLQSLGVTAVGSMEYRRDVQEVLAHRRQARQMRIRVTLLDREWPLDVAMAERIAGDEWLRVIGFKAFLDGTLGSRTAKMLEPYADQPDNRGLWVELAERGVLHAWARLVADAGLSPSMHAIGDDAVRLALDVAESLGEGEHVRIEHAQTVHPRDVPRFRGRITSMQPLHKADDARIAEARLGRDRMERFFPFRSLHDAGAMLAFGSDWPIVSPDPLLGVQAAVTGLSLDGRCVAPEQNLTVTEALAAYTVGAASALRMNGFGRLEAEAPADLVVLDRNPFGVEWTKERPRVVMTVVGGTVIYES